MSTNALVLSQLGGPLRAVSVHWDGYPTHLGQVIHQMAAQHFAGAPEQLAAYLIDEHPDGWSTLGGDPQRTIGADVERYASDGGLDGRYAQANVCYCHCQGNQPGQPISAAQLAGGEGAFAEWCYRISEQHLDIIAGPRPLEDADVQVAWGDQQVNWERVECGEHFERCGHYCSAHFQVPDVSAQLPTAVWLGREPMNARYAVGYRLADGRLARSGGYARQDGDGSRREELILEGGARITEMVLGPGGLPPAGVEPIFPPTALDDPHLLDGLLPGVGR